MPKLDIETLLLEIPGDFPCGPDLEYDPLFVALNKAAEGIPERRMGESIIQGKEPEWPTVKEQALELLEHTKDIRVTIHLTKALLALDYLPGFASGISLIRQLLEKYWDTIHPQLDHEDDNDPTMRLSSLIELTDLPLLNAIRVSPLAKAKGIGDCCMRDIAIAFGDMSVPGDISDNAPTPTVIEAIFAGCSQDELRTTIDSVKGTVEDVEAIERYVNQRVGSAHAFSLEELLRLLKQADRILGDHAPVSNELDGTMPLSDGQQNELNIEGTQSMKRNPTGKIGALGEIRSREEVILALDKVCEYYHKFEPSSPVPLLIHRSKRLVSMNFTDIIRDLAPTGIKEVELIQGGKEKDSQ